MRIKYTLQPGALLPTKATPGAAGYDAYAYNVSHERLYVEIDLGLSVEIPEGWCIKVYPRSSVSKTGMVLANSTGIIDSDYRGSIKVRFYRGESDYADVYKEGDRCCQLVLEPAHQIDWEDAESLTETTRGTGGFGSTGWF